MKQIVRQKIDRKENRNGQPFLQGTDAHPTPEIHLPSTWGRLAGIVIASGFSTLALLVGCTSHPTAATNLVLSQDTYVTAGKEERQPRRKGDSITLGNEPLLLEAPGHIGLLIVPVNGAPSELTPKLIPTEDWAGEAFGKALRSQLSQIVTETNRIQILISRREGQQALERVEALQRQYPQIPYLQFLRASSLYVIGETEKAKVALEAGLKDLPDDANASKFYEFLGGRLERKPAAHDPLTGERSEP